MKRSQLKRSNGLTRSRMRQGKGSGKYALRERDIPYLLWVKTLPCLLAGYGQCHGVGEADHAGLRGLGQKCPDREAVPLCTGHHLSRHECTGFFRKREDETYTEVKQRKRDWCQRAITKTQAECEAAEWFHRELDEGI